MASPTRRLGYLVISCVALLALAELTLRFGFGLGRPLLMMRHSTIEYLAQPNQEVWRFGHRVSYNEYSMRSNSFSRQKSNSREFRILLIGDSVVNAGSTLDQSELAAAEIEQVLSLEWNRPVIVMNVSAGSWGPENQLAYVREYGLFDCDVAVVVWSTHDFDDVPTFGPLHPVSHPVTPPSSALSEAIFRYALPLLQREDPAGASVRGRRAEAEMRALLGFLKKRVSVLVLLHLTEPELKIAPEADIAYLRQLSVESNVHFESLGPEFARALAEGAAPYRPGDPIHTTRAGQHLIATRVLRWLRRERGPSDLPGD